MTAGERLEAALATLLYDEQARAIPGDVDSLFASLDRGELEEAAASVRKMVRSRTHRGTGGMEQWYPQTLASWRTLHAADGRLDDLLLRFCASPVCGDWRESPAGEPGISLEEALYRFFCDADIGDPAVREEEFLGAVVRGLAITPSAGFVWPKAVRRAPGGCFAVTGSLVLHAALDGRYLRGPVTPLLADLMRGISPAAAAERHGVTPAELETVTGTLKKMRIVE
jgi:hypothetical protein